MRSPRWQKLWRDIWLARGRMTMMVIAIAVSILGVGTVLSAYTILTREITLNYRETNPASATLELDRIDESLLEAVRRRPGIADAEARASLTARVQVGPGQWRPLLLFVIDDFEAMRIATVDSEAGAWPPPTGSMLIERLALQVLEAELGDEVLVKAPSGRERTIAISGRVHDRSLAPAVQERTGYGYITPATLEWLGEPPVLNELKITVSAQPLEAAAIERTARDLAGWLQQQGREVHEILIPPPGQHPHQSQMVALLTLLLVFALMALVLSAILISTIISGLLAQQVRQIGVMKAVGAATRQIAGIYVVMILLIGSVAVALGVPLSVAGGRGFARAVADLLNFTLHSQAIPGWVFLVQGSAGLLVPLLAALGPILRGCRITVREAIADFGVSQEPPPGRVVSSLLGVAHGLDRSLLLALRNTFRRRGRLALTLGLLAVGGAMFMTGLNVRMAWDHMLADGFAARRYDLEIRLSRPEPVKSLVPPLSSLPGVELVEPWGYAPTTPSQPGMIDLVRSYPDGGHGSFTLRGVPSGTGLVQFPLLDGRWLQPGDSRGVVLNQIALAQLPGVTVGDTVTLSVSDHPMEWTVVGIVQEIGSPAAAYVTAEALERAIGLPGHAGSFRLVTADLDPDARADLIRSVEQTLTEANVGVAMVTADSEWRTAVGDHLAILISALLFMAALTAVVGALGLLSTMSTNIAERTREFGVMQAIGGTPKTVVRIVVTEGLLIGLLSWVLALVLSLPASAMVGSLLGNLSFRVPLPLALSAQGVLLWLAVTVVGAAAASALPAWRASQLTIRETLSYV